MNSPHKIGSVEAPLVYLCYGASGLRKHKLSIAGDDASPWVGQELCVISRSGQSLPIECSPPVGTFQKLSSVEGCEWGVECPVDGEDVDFDCLIKSEFTAAPYCIPMRMGHYLHEFTGIKTHIPSPLIDEKLEIEVQVISAYTKKKLVGVEVKWHVDEEFVRNEDTVELGVSKFIYAFQKEGLHTITACVYNPYDDTWTSHTFPVRVYESSPWKEAKLTVNGVVLPWGSPVVLPHGQPSEVTVEVTPEIAKKLSLNLVDVNGPITKVEPKENELHDPVDGKFKWTLTPQTGLGGRVTLLFVSQEVTQNWEHDCRVLSPNLGDEFYVRYDGQPIANDRNFFFREDPRDITLAPKEDSAIAGLPIALTYEIKSNLDDENLRCSPGFGEPVKAQSWSLTGSTKSGIFNLIFTCPGITMPFVLPLNVLLSTDLNEEAEARLEGDVIAPGGTVLFRGEANTLTLVAKSGSPFGHLPVSLQWASGTLEADDFLCDPALDEKIKAHSWSITGPVGKSGTIGFKLACEGMSTPLELPVCWVLSKNFDDEGTFLVGGTELTPDGTVWTRGVEQTLTLVPKQGSPVGDLLKSLQWVSGDGLVKEDFTCGPALDEETRINSWKITGSATKSGRFRLKLVGPGMVPLVQLPACMLLSRNLEDDVTIKIDGADIPASGKVFIRSKPHTLTLEPKPGSLVADLMMSLQWGSGTGLGKENFSWQPPLEQLIKPHSWIITGPADKSGTFSLVVAGPGGITLITLTVMTLLSANLRDEADLLFAGNPVPAEGVAMLRGRQGVFSIRPKSNSPIAGVPLSLKYVPGGSLPETAINSQPGFGVPDAVHDWTLTGPADRSGTFGAKVTCEGGAEFVMDTTLVLSPDLNDEVSGISITQAGGSPIPVDLSKEGMWLTKDSAELTITLPESSPLLGRTVALKWLDGLNPSIEFPEQFVVSATTRVEIKGVDDPAASKRHQLCLDYQGAISQPWIFRYFNGLPSNELKILCEGVYQGNNPVLLKFNKSYELSIVPKIEDSVFEDWMCTFADVEGQGIKVACLSSNKDVIIKAPSLGGGKMTVRAQKMEGFNGGRVVMPVAFKEFDELKITFEIDQLESDEK
ncbi:hypothetical protein [Pseudomonas migulae]|uniref:Uncharacterized protein n=1 Tax=Pseudomonas migulae TaxID=78543 RepID=A0A1H5K2N6_9PSED|nr:hypothetical protein [Pseudomonas migulae]SEE58777.1 hypothetical protein SAMN04490194_2948 [Pseudomonas migulae]